MSADSVLSVDADSGQIISLVIADKFKTDGTGSAAGDTLALTIGNITS